MIRSAPRYTLFPYTTLFRSVVDRRLREHLAHQGDLRRRGAVEMAHAAGPHGAEHARLGVALDGVEHVARKAGDEAARRRLRSEEHTSELQSHVNLVCRLLLE